MKPVIRYVLFTLAVAAFAALTVVLVHQAHGLRHRETCKGLQVRILDDYSFVTPDDVKDYLDRLYGPYIGQRLDSVRLDRIEKILDRQSAILKSEAWTGRDSLLHVDITQREPVVRFQKGADGFYVDERGCIFPLQRNYTSLVPVVDGFLPLDAGAGYKGEETSPKGREWIAGVLDMVAYMKKSRTWDENIVQISVLEDGDIVMIPRQGRERFLFGSPTQAASKFARIAAYYRYIKPACPENFYRTVNVKFDGQIICKKQ